ncbi:MAG: hypothetical protein HRT74_00440, partial [Flavobacteriales bacterium]|nr:hypothetical protein [Flavobacteriales bacterium]
LDEMLYNEEFGNHEEHGDHDDHGHHHGPSKEELRAELNEINAMLASDKVSIFTEASIEAKEETMYNLQRQKERILDIEKFDLQGNISSWEAGKDDQIVKGEFHLPVGKEVEFVFRSRDVIHSAYMPHFRAQMNTVPGVPTRFKMVPSITTDSMRTILDDPEFDYVLLCNKVCGAAHFNMQMKVVIESEEDYNNWLEEQKTFIAKEEPAETPETEDQAIIEETNNEGEEITASLGN